MTLSPIIQRFHDNSLPHCIYTPLFSSALAKTLHVPIHGYRIHFHTVSSAGNHSLHAMLRNPLQTVSPLMETQELVQLEEILESRQVGR